MKMLLLVWKNSNKFLRKKGLDINAYNEGNLSLGTAIQALFMEIFNKINDILMHNRNVFGFDTIDRIFMSTDNGRVKGLKEFLHAFGYTDTAINDFNLLKNCNAQRFFSCIVASYVTISICKMICLKILPFFQDHHVF